MTNICAPSEAACDRQNDPDMTHSVRIFSMVKALGTAPEGHHKGK